MLIEKDLKQQVLVSNANLKQLQAQINPHFMYNSYYVLYRLLKMKDYESGMVLSENLGAFFQYITKSTDDEKLLCEEMEHALVYTRIQSYRFRGRIKVEFMDLPMEYKNILVPRLIMQPIIENAFKYAFDYVPTDEQATLCIGFTVKDNFLDISIENSGEITDADVESIYQKLGWNGDAAEVTALVNIKRRLDLYWETDNSMEILHSGPGGLAVHIYIRIPSEEPM